MTDSPHTQRCCVVCGTTDGPLHDHHIATRAIHETATVPACPRCHIDLTNRQRRSGLFDAQRPQGGDGRALLMAALTEGVTAIVASGARLYGATDLERDSARFRWVAIRLLASVPGDSPAVLAPPPPANGSRGSPGNSPRGSAAIEIKAPEALAGLFPALSEVIAEALPGGELLPGFTAAQLRELFSRDRLLNHARALTALEDHPRIGELGEVIQRGREVIFHVLAQLERAAETEGLGESAEINPELLIAAGQVFRELTRGLIQLTSDLSSTDQPASASAALERFLEVASAALSNPVHGSEI